MIAKPKLNPSLLPSKDISLAHLAKLNSYLDSEHVRAKYVNKEIVLRGVYRKIRYKWPRKTKGASTKPSTTSTATERNS